jgi:hypothetical protein
MSGPRPPDDFEAELLGTWAEEQARYERGEWDFRTTLWSRVSYRLARPRGAERPSPVPGKWNVTDAFRSRFARAVRHLVSAGLLRRRSVRGGDPQRRFTLGYHLHNLRERDVFLTPAGKEWVTQNRPPVAREGATAAGSASYVYVEPSGDAGANAGAPPTTYTWEVTASVGMDEE